MSQSQLPAWDCRILEAQLRGRECPSRSLGTRQSDFLAVTEHWPRRHDPSHMCSIERGLASVRTQDLMISLTVMPEGIMGSTCSWYGTRTSSRYGPSLESISRIAPGTSFLWRIWRPGTPKPAAILTKSGYGGEISTSPSPVASGR